MAEIDETIREFLVESFENLDRYDQKLIELEENPLNTDSINHIFRIVHTIKGTCGFFEYHKLEAVSHIGENLLDSLRDGAVPVSKDVVTALLRLGDALRTMLSAIEQNGTEGGNEYRDLQELLSSLNNPESVPAPSAAGAEPHSQKVIRLEEVVDEPPVTHSEMSDLDRMFYEAQQEYRSAQAAETSESHPVDECTAPQSGLEHSAREPQADVSIDAVAFSEEGKSNKEAASVVGEETKKAEIAETALRVDINLLDKLMNLVGELVLARNQILQFTKNQANGEFASTSQRLNLITSELQEGVMRTRMQPIANVWNKLPRVVRDVAHSCGKKVRLEMFGKETELDKTIIEAIKDPLTHIIRNAVDHGIENPEVRCKAGKQPEGVLTMKAFHEGGQVIIEISDDGAGLNVEKLRKKAVERGIITSEKGSRMSDQEVQRLIFLPGFSTAEKVTNISGRGVGMDVVRSNIERIGGAVDVGSKLGSGTVFTIKIPLTLAIIPALIATAGGNRYAIPQVNLLELVRIEGAQIKKNLEDVQDALFYRLRGRLLPIIRLRDELRLTPEGATKIKDEQVLNIVVVRADNHQFGLIVDAIFDTEEIVVKPLGKLLKHVSSFAGATIMGDGRVALILDVVGLAKSAKITKESSHEQSRDSQAESASQGSKSKLLIFQVGANRRAAIPLEQVHRLEEFESSKIEYAGGMSVVQYRGGILPLVDLNGALNGKAPEYGSAVRAFVCRLEGQFVGFIVSEIVDIVEQVIKVETPFRRPGLLGSAVIQGTVTDLVDLSAVVKQSEINLSGEGYGSAAQ